MRESSPHLVPTAAGSALTSAAAEELIRRAVEIDSKRAEVVTLAQIKATLAPLGVADRTVERAAAEVEYASRRQISRNGIMAWIWAVIGYSIVCVPGILLLVRGVEQGGGSLLIQGWMGLVWILFVVGVFLDVAHEDREIRRSRALDAPV
jgi:hypothetical protein